MIDLCVVNYNTGWLLQRFMYTLYDSAEQPYPFNLFIADNGSTDGSEEVINTWAKEQRFLRVFNSNVGYSAACNALASMGGSDIIGLLNADVWLTQKDLEQIQTAFNEDPGVAILSPKERDERGYITHAGMFGTNENVKHQGWRTFDPEDRLYRIKQEAITVTGSAYFIRRSVWNDLWNCPVYREQFPNATGAFLPTPHYYEETWCSYHARAHGYKVFYDGRTSIGHSWHASSPVGGEADAYFPISQKIFRSACDAHGIPRD